MTVVVEGDGGTERDGTNQFSRTFKVTVGQMSQPLLRIARTADAVVLRFETVPGASYTLEAADALNPTAWTPLATYAGTGLTQTVSETVRPGTTRFYRLVQR